MEEWPIIGDMMPAPGYMGSEGRPAGDLVVDISVYRVAPTVGGFGIMIPVPG